MARQLHKLLEYFNIEDSSIGLALIKTAIANRQSRPQCTDTAETRAIMVDLTVKHTSTVRIPNRLLPSSERVILHCSRLVTPHQTAAQTVLVMLVLNLVVAMHAVTTIHLARASSTLFRWIWTCQ